MPTTSTHPEVGGAVCVRGPGQHEYIETEVPVPGRHDVLVEVAAAGICGSDAELPAGSRPDEYVRYPIVPGHEWSGTIVEVGAEVSGLWAGQHVVAEGIRFCGTCDRCREGLTNLCQSGYDETGFTKPGAFADYLAVPARLVHVLPDEVSVGDAALIEPTSIVVAGLRHVAPRTDSVLTVVGTGTLGLIAVQLLALHHPARLIAVDRRADRLELAEHLGATETWCLGDGELPEELVGAADVAYEGAAATARSSRHCTRPAAGEPSSWRELPARTRRRCRPTCSRSTTCTCTACSARTPTPGSTRCGCSAGIGCGWGS